MDSLEALALGRQIAGDRGEITFAVDAARGEFYLAKFELENEGIRNIEPTRLAKRDEFEALLESGQPVIGPSLAEKYPVASGAFSFGGICRSLGLPADGVRRGVRA